MYRRSEKDSNNSYCMWKNTEIYPALMIDLITGAVFTAGKWRDDTSDYLIRHYKKLEEVQNEEKEYNTNIYWVCCSSYRTDHCKHKADKAIHKLAGSCCKESIEVLNTEMAL